MGGDESTVLPKTFPNDRSQLRNSHSLSLRERARVRAALGLKALASIGSGRLLAFDWIAPKRE
jgi:hypothetical protein